MTDCPVIGNIPDVVISGEAPEPWPVYLKEEISHGQLLHAKVLGFIHPVTGTYMEWDCELPEYFQKVLFVFRSLQ